MFRGSLLYFSYTKYSLWMHVVIEKWGYLWPKDTNVDALQPSIEVVEPIETKIVEPPEVKIEGNYPNN